MMKIIKNLFTLTALVIIAVLSSCTSDNDDIDTGNTSDIAVTGDILKVSSTYAAVYGYANPSQLPKTVTEAYMGFQVSDDPTMKNPKRSLLMEPLEFSKSTKENAIADQLSGLGPNKTYYYQTFVYANNGEYYYGEVRSLKTKGMVNVVTSCSVKDITNHNCLFTLLVNPSDFPDFGDDDADVEDAAVGVFYSKNQSHLSNIENILSNMESGDRDVYHKEDLVSYSTEYSRNEVVKHYKWPTRLASLSWLDSGTTYYYRTYTKVNGSYALGDVASFTTLK